MATKRSWSVGAAMACVVLLLSACSSDDSDAATTTSSSVPTSGSVTEDADGDGPDVRRPDPGTYGPLAEHAHDPSTVVAGVGECDLESSGIPDEPADDDVSLYFTCELTEPRQNVFEYAAPARIVSAGDGGLQDVLRRLFAGPTEAERSAGWRSHFAEVTADLPFTVRMEADMAVVDVDPAILDMGDARILDLRWEIQQIVGTAGQFPAVRWVAVLVGGEPPCAPLGYC